MQIKRLLRNISKAVKSRFSQLTMWSSDMTTDAEEQLAACEDIQSALLEIKKDVNKEENTDFWIKMRQNIEDEITDRPGLKFSLTSLIEEKWWGLVSVPLAAAVAISIFIFHQSPVLTEDDLWLISGNLPVIEEVVTNEMDYNGYFVEKESYRGISSGWTALLSETI